MKSTSHLERLGFVPDHEIWPAGFYRAPEAYATHIVVLRELPLTPDTLLLRLLGSGETFARAFAELNALPHDAWASQHLLPVLLAFRKRFYKTGDKDMLPLTEELLATYDKMVADTRREGRKEGIREGIHQGVRNTLLGMYEARLGTPPAALVQALRAERDLEVLQGYIGPFMSLSADELRVLVVGDA